MKFLFYYYQSNGKVEFVVKIVKFILRKIENFVLNFYEVLFD